MSKPVGALIDDVIKRGNRLKPIRKGFMKRSEDLKGRKTPYHIGVNKIIACIRILRGRGMVVYYKEDE